jgi:hypothetical protein
MEVPAALLNHLALDGLDREVTNVVPPIVVSPDSNYIIQGKRVTDPEVPRSFQDRLRWGRVMVLTLDGRSLVIFGVSRR